MIEGISEPTDIPPLELREALRHKLHDVRPGDIVWAHQICTNPACGSEPHVHAVAPPRLSTMTVNVHVVDPEEPRQ